MAGEQELRNNLDLFSEILSRTAIRLSGEGLERAFDISVKLYIAANDYPNPSYKGSIGSLVQRVTASMSNSEVVKRLPVLAGLPIPDYDEEIYLPVEPFHYLSRVTVDPACIERSEWDSKISTLLNYLVSESPVQRRRSILRLQQLNTWGILTPEEQIVFGERLWHKLDQEGFPEDAPLYTHAFLFLPHPAGIDIKQKVKDYLLAHSFAPVARVDERGGISWGWGGDSERYINELIGASYSKFSKEDTDKLIQWDAVDIDKILEKLSVSWDADKRFLNHRNRELASSVETRIRSFERILERVIFPNIHNLLPATKAALWTFLNDLRANNVRILAVLPLTILLKEDNQEFEVPSSIERQIVQGLYSIDEADVKEAMIAVYNWMAYVTEMGIPLPETDIVGDLISHIALRNPSTVADAIQFFIFIFKYHPSICKGQHIAKVLLGLGSLLEETNLVNLASPKNVFSLYFGTEARNIVPQIRSLASELSRLLYDHNVREEKPIPEVLQAWKLAAAEETLPEVRNAWESSPPVVEPPEVNTDVVTDSAGDTPETPVDLDHNQA